jgi:toxin FitB
LITLDASVLIGHLNVSDANREVARRLLAACGPVTFSVSQITLAEALVKPIRDGRERQVRADIRQLGVVETPFGPHAAVRLAKLRAQTNLRMPECCVLLAAEDSDATAILTLDDRLRAEARQLGFDSPDAVQP